jgi:hypothetical protein
MKDSTRLLLASLADHPKAKYVAANSCGKKRTWVSTGPNLHRCPSMLAAQLVMTEAEKPIDTSSYPGNLLYNLLI